MYGRCSGGLRAVRERLRRLESSTECRCSQCQFCLFLQGSAGLMSAWFTIRPYSCACIPFGKGCGEEFATRITFRQGMRCAACRECDPGLRPSYIYIYICRPTPTGGCFFPWVRKRHPAARLWVGVGRRLDWETKCQGAQCSVCSIPSSLKGITSG